jgi:hypothetical protein
MGVAQRSVNGCNARVVDSYGPHEQKCVYLNTTRLNYCRYLLFRSLRLIIGLIKDIDLNMKIIL